MAGRKRVMEPESKFKLYAKAAKETRLPRHRQVPQNSGRAWRCSIPNSRKYGIAESVESVQQREDSLFIMQGAQFAVKQWV